MAYITASEVKCIEDALEKQMPEYEFKINRDKDLSGVTIIFLAGPALETHKKKSKSSKKNVIKYNAHKNVVRHNSVTKKALTIAKTAPKGKGGINDDGWLAVCNPNINLYYYSYIIKIKIGELNSPYQICNK